MAEKSQKIFEILPIRNKFMIYFVENGCEIHLELKPSTNKLIINKYDNCEKSHESLFLVLLSLKVDKSMINAETQVVTGVVDTAKTSLPSIVLSPTVQISGVPITLAQIEAANTVLHSRTDEEEIEETEEPRTGVCDPNDYYSCMDSKWKKTVSEEGLPTRALIDPAQNKGSQMKWPQMQWPQMQWSQTKWPQMQWPQMQQQQMDSTTLQRIVDDFYQHYPNGADAATNSRFVARLYDLGINASVIDTFLTLIADEEPVKQKPAFELPEEGSVSSIKQLIELLRDIETRLTKKDQNEFVDAVRNKYKPVIFSKFSKKGGKKTRKSKKRKQKTRRNKI
jgi:hypothetical protein